jgi:hypothetical protein
MPATVAIVRPTPYQCGPTMPMATHLLGLAGCGHDGSWAEGSGHVAGVWLWAAAGAEDEAVVGGSEGELDIQRGRLRPVCLGAKPGAGDQGPQAAGDIAACFTTRPEDLTGWGICDTRPGW